LPRPMLATLLAVWAPVAFAWSCAHPPAITAGRQRASVAIMGSFDDMLAKTKKRDEERAATPAAPPPLAGTSLASQMFGTIKDSLSSIGGDSTDEDDTTDSQDAPTGSGADDVVADIDLRAQTGDLTFKDFLTMGEAFAGLGDKSLPGVPTLTPAQLAETREKFEKHTKIVEVMLEDEQSNPSLLIEDLKAGGATPGPRIQRLAVASNVRETEVGLFLMQFEAMRESTRRIADGEDPDEVNASMSAPPGANRQARRAAQKRTAKADKKKVKK